MAAAAVTYSAIVTHTAAFLADALADPLLRRSLLSSAAAAGDGGVGGAGAVLQALSLISDALEAPTASPSPSSLRAAERLLLALPSPTPLSCLLLALAAAARRRSGAAAAAAVLDAFALDPALARHELAPGVFEALFVPRLAPVARHFAGRRAAALAAGAAADERSVEVAAAAAMRVVSLMSGAQAQEMRALEREYEKVLDVNCKAYALYLKKVLEAGEMARASPPLPPPPELVFGVGDGEVEEEEEEEEVTAATAEEGIGLRNGARDNPIWAESGGSVELLSRQGSQRILSRPPSLYPQRVPPHLIMRQPSRGGGGRNPSPNYLPEPSPAVPSDDSLDDSSSELYEKDATRGNSRLFSEPISCPSPPMGDSDSLLSSSSTGRRASTPKDFVCPITSQVFDDPVTLETGQTYERRAIQEWLGRGNTSCPITRQQLQNTQLPKTNYVLKRLIAAWQEHNPPSPRPSPTPPTPTPTRMESSPLQKSSPDRGSQVSAPSPTSVISQASYESIIGDLRAAVSCICTSEVLAEAEAAVLKIERIWRDGNAEPGVLATLAKPAVINGFVEILFNSVTAHVLQVTAFLLAELAYRDNAVVQTLTRVESDVDCMVALFKKGLVEAVVLIYLLRPSPDMAVEMEMADALVATIRRGDDDGPLKMCVQPRAASVFLLDQVIRGDGEGAAVPRTALASERFIRGVAMSMEGEQVEERVAAVRILVRCVEEDGHCRTTIAERAVLSPVLEGFHLVGDADKFEIVRFLCELLKLKKRSNIERLLRIIKEGGAFSMMHTLLVYLQAAAPEQSPFVAGLLLQLDLLLEPRKTSMYREEAIDSLIACLKNPDFPRSQLLAAETIMSLQGKFASSGRPLARSVLLKLARMKERYRGASSHSQELSLARGDAEDDLEEEKAASDWERKAAYALSSHEFGLVFEALAEGLKSKSSDLFTTCLVSSAWLTHMLSLLPDTGIRGAARVCLLRQFVFILRSAKHAGDRALAMVALRSFMNDHEGMHDITMYIKDVLKTLREMKKSSGLAFEMLKLLSDGQESSIDIWSHKELKQVDCSANGEVLAIIYFKSFIFSGHSDGTIKVWEGSEDILRLIGEAREHSKAITSLAILQSEEKLYSGSLDKSIRVWRFREGLRCIEVNDTKEPVHNLVVANTVACFIPQGAGVKVLNWNGNSKLLNQSKYVRSMALYHGKLFCGCNDSSIQEIDLASGTTGVIQSGNKKLLGKANPIYTLQAHDGLLYTGSTYLDGASVKIWNSSNYNLVGSIPSSTEVRSLVVNADLIYLGSRAGAVEIWSREKLTKIGTLEAGSNCRVHCLAVDADGDVLVVGTSDGRIQAWGLA